MPTSKILTRHPRGKRGVNIDRDKYETLRKAILAVLQKKELTTNCSNDWIGASKASSPAASLGTGKR